MIAAPSCWVFYFALQMLIFKAFGLQIRKTGNTNIQCFMVIEPKEPKIGTKVYRYYCL